MRGRATSASSSCSTTTTCRSRRRRARSQPTSLASPRAAPTSTCATSPSSWRSSLPKSWERRAARMEEYTRHLWQGGTWFEELGFYYVGPIDGHNFDQLLPVLKNVRDAKQGPILVHVVTKKGKGYAPAEASDDKYHGVAKFNVVTGAQVEDEAERADLYARVRRQPHRRGEEGRQDRRHHRGDARRHGPRPLRQGVPRAHLRRRHRRAARGDVRRRAGDGRAQAVCGHLFDVPAARLRPGRARRRRPAPPRSLRHRPRRSRRRRRSNPRRLIRPRLSQLPARVRRHGGSRRGGAARTWWRPQRQSTTALARSAIRAAKAAAWSCPSSECRWRSARAASCARAPPWRCSRSARARPNA